MKALEHSQELKTTDNDGNVWKMKLFKDDPKSNRWQFSFFFNEKEFSLMKPQNNLVAQNIWELLERIKITPQTDQETEEEIIMPLHTIRPKKRTAKK